MIKPLNGQVVCKVEEKPDIVSKGVILVQSDKDNNFKAEIMAIAADVVDADFKVGDKVFFDKSRAETHKGNDIEYLLVKADDILGVWDAD